MVNKTAKKMKSGNGPDSDGFSRLTFDNKLCSFRNITVDVDHCPNRIYIFFLQALACKVLEGELRFYIGL